MGSIPMLDGNGVKAIPGWFLHPILVPTIIEKNENTGSQMGHTKKIYKKKKVFKIVQVPVRRPPTPGTGGWETLA